MERKLLKIGYSPAQADIILNFAASGEGIAVVCGLPGSKIEKTFRVFESLGFDVSLDDISSGKKWNFLRFATKNALEKIGKSGKRATLCITQRKVPLLFAPVRWDAEKASAHDREDAERLFSLFPDMDFSGAMTGKGSEVSAIIHECALAEKPEDASWFLSFGERNPMESLARAAAELVAKGVVDPAQGARFGGILGWRRSGS